MNATDNHIPQKRFVPLALKTQYDEMKGRINRAFNNLLMLEYDHKLLVEYGYEIFFAVDFHEMYSFAFPFGDLLLSGKDIFSEDSIKSITNAQIARSYLFFGEKDIVGPPILLPPHEKELRRTIKHYLEPESVFLRAILQVDDLRKLKERIIDELKMFPEVRQAFIKYKKSEDIPKRSYSALFDYFEQRFRALTHALSGVATGGFIALRKLITSESNKKAPVQYAFRVWPQYMTYIEKIMKSELINSDWREYLVKLRGKELSISNLRDAQALEIIFGINKKINKNKKVLLLVSDVYSMQAALKIARRDGMLRIKELTEPLPVLRTSETFLAYLFYARGNPQETLENIKRNRIRLDKFKKLELSLDRLINSCAAKSSYPEEEECLACPVRRHCKATAKALNEFQKEMDKLDEIHLLIKGASYLKEFVSPDKLRGEMKKTVKIMVDFIEASSVALRNEAVRKENYLLKKLDEDRRNFAIQLIGFLRYLVEDKVGFAKDVKRDEERSRELISFIFTKYRLKFVNNEIITEFKKMRSIINDEYEGLEEMSYGESLFMSMLQLIDLSGRKDIEKRERRLLLSALLLAHKKYNHSMRVATDTRNELDTPEEKTEFYYVEMMIRYLWAKDAKFSWYDYLKQVELSKKVLKLYPKDVRFNNIHGLIMGDLIEEVLKENSEEISKKVPYNFDMVIKCFNAAYNKINQCESDLQGVILNNWAWYLYRRGKEGDLSSAYEKIEQMEIIENLEWLPDYSHTQGVVLLELAKEAKEDNISNWKSKAEKAVGKIEECVRRAKDLKYTKELLELYEEDLSKSKEFLESS